MTADTGVAAASGLTHEKARELWGLPDEQQGNVNNPRAAEEHGIRFNEKWTYYLTGDELRLVYWYRYDCCGVVRQAADGSGRPEAF